MVKAGQSTLLLLEGIESIDILAILLANEDNWFNVKIFGGVMSRDDRNSLQACYHHLISSLD